ncbi:hypothetical protein Zmor_011734 [Zophobas morio]|jgi:hypothetical protein|uniref:Uncharacterized protein n=1 Tax=Zophobas morio TaxID=2755281 RepID=A0AA38HKB8_9CUCU|nr:hypothetical protein Zmor_011734 [Zophobas morio]
MGALSKYTITKEIEEMADDIDKQTLRRMTARSYISLALEESCDETDTAQLCIYALCQRTIRHNRRILDMRHQIFSKKGFRGIKDVIDNRQINWDKLDNVCTNRAPALTG